jgi:hypothetical protein
MPVPALSAASPLLEELQPASARSELPAKSATEREDAKETEVVMRPTFASHVPLEDSRKRAGERAPGVSA